MDRSMIVAQVVPTTVEQCARVFAGPVATALPRPAEGRHRSPCPPYDRHVRPGETGRPGRAPVAGCCHRGDPAAGRRS
ncbi:hypothetical protein C5N14_17625 [Micromonospora sp. MW-13]|uniref:hypothetical protein n=1 Tax=Micromonospora sp. MW-13 TaxID=2094022 RepID=UPI000EBD5B59|nr:hypothetical protein [Micromonospora sp. MW-13]RGC67600.1 hypothetical protein C5N14_17625 [Micromonospora sp. MW-13]